MGRGGGINKARAGRIHIKGRPVFRQTQGSLYAAGNAWGGRWGRERCHNTAGNVVCRQTAVGQGLTGGGDGQRGGILVFGAVIALADAGAGRDPFIAGVHLPAQILVRHHTVGQCPTGSQQL